MVFIYISFIGDQTSLLGIKLSHRITTDCKLSRLNGIHPVAALISMFSLLGKCFMVITGRWSTIKKVHIKDARVHHYLNLFTNLLNSFHICTPNGQQNLFIEA